MAAQPLEQSVLLGGRGDLDGLEVPGERVAVAGRNDAEVSFVGFAEEPAALEGRVAKFGLAVLASHEQLQSSGGQLGLEGEHVQGLSDGDVVIEGLLDEAVAAVEVVGLGVELHHAFSFLVM